MILQPKFSFPDSISLNIASKWSRGCWATIQVGRGEEWLDAYSPKWGMKVKPEYVAWRIARRILGDAKPFFKVKKVQDLVLSCGLADEAIRLMDAYLERVDAAAKLVAKELDEVEIAAKAQITNEVPKNCLDTAMAFEGAVSVNVTVFALSGTWTWTMRAKAKPQTKGVSDSFLKNYWPEAKQDHQVPTPIKEAMSRMEADLAKRIIEVANATLTTAKQPDSFIMVELDRRVHQNRIIYHAGLLQHAVASARRHGLSDNEISTIWKELIVEDIHSS